MENSFYSEFTIIENRFMKENVFTHMEPEDRPLPTYEGEKEKDRRKRTVGVLPGFRRRRTGCEQSGLICFRATRSLSQRTGT